MIFHMIVSETPYSGMNNAKKLSSDETEVYITPSHACLFARICAAARHYDVVFHLQDASLLFRLRAGFSSHFQDAEAIARLMAVVQTAPAISDNSTLRKGNIFASTAWL